MPQLTLLGASVRAAAVSTIRAGWLPWAIDLFADRDLATVCPTMRIERYPGDFAAALDKAPEGAWLYTGGLENYPRLVDRLAARRPLLGNAGSVLRRVRDVRHLAQVLREADFRFPRTFCGDGDRLPPLEGTDGTTRSWLVKPLRASGGMSIRWATERDLASLPRGSVLQQFVAGEPASAIFVAAAGRATLLGATRQLVGSDFGSTSEFAYAGSIGPLTLLPAEREPLDALGTLLAERFALVGLFGVDYVRTVAGPTIIEINPRYTASVEVLERATAESFIARHIAACHGESWAPLGASSIAFRQTLCGKAIVYARHNAVVPEQLQRLTEEWNAQVAYPLAADLPWIGQALVAGQPVLTAFATGASSDVVEAILRQRVAAVHEVLELSARPTVV